MSAHLDSTPTATDNAIDILMLGASGVGKSSMLAAMYEQFPQASSSVSLHCQTQKMETRLVKKVQQLRQASGSLNNHNGIEGTSQRIDYPFKLSLHKDRSQHIPVKFIDVPGGWVDENHAQHTELQNLMQNARILMLPIHTPALMTQDEQFHQDINQAEKITWLLKEIHFKQPTLILLAPVKCEAYTGQPEKLLQQITTHYRSLINVLSDQPQVALAITPIETMGNMRFSYWDKNQQDHYFRVGQQPYAPRFVEQPLCYALNFSLNIFLREQRSSLWRWLDDLLPFLNLDGHCKAALVSLSNQIKTREAGFLLLQGEHLLREID